MKIEQIMNPGVQSCGMDDSLVHAARTMWRLGCTALPVCGPGGELRGQLDARHLFQRACVDGLVVAELRVSDAQLRSAARATAGTSVGESVQRVTAAQTDRLYVVDESDRLVGVVTARSLTAAAHMPANALASHASGGWPDVEFQGWTLMIDRHELTAPEGETIPIQRNPLRLLLVLLNNPGRVLTRTFLSRSVCNRDWDPTDRYIDVLIGQLRKKLRDDCTRQRIIRTVHGRGYLFVPAVKHSRARWTADCSGGVVDRQHPVGPRTKLLYAQVAGV